LWHASLSDLINAAQMIQPLMFKLWSLID
jgi:hypothetical protein